MENHKEGPEELYVVKTAQEFALGNSILMTVFKEIVDPLPFPSVSPQCIFQFLPPELKKKKYQSLKINGTELEILPGLPALSRYTVRPY